MNWKKPWKKTGDYCLTKTGCSQVGKLQLMTKTSCVEEFQLELKAANAEKARLSAESRRARMTCNGGRTSAGNLGATPPIAPEVAELFAQQSKALQQQSQTLQAVMQMIANMPAQGAQVVAPPIITVVSTQTDAKKVALQRVQEILQLFEPTRRAAA